jgi:hypothetical protein
MKSFTGSKKGRHADVDAAVLHFDSERDPEWVSITQQAMQVKATETVHHSKMNFKAGHGWCDRFMPHEGLSVRHRMSVSRFPSDIQEKLQTSDYTFS